MAFGERLQEVRRRAGQAPRAVFLAEPVADTIAVTGTVLLFSFQFRKALRKLESENKT